MRLTLRTLLAYMDGILDPADHENLSQQIAASDFANDLIHRTRDTTRRARLASPPLEDDGSGFDPNTVAEYLDNTATVQVVADFERHCLESDSQLAEVASCHHILTMVLGERAEVDPEARRRMYAIPEVAEAIAQHQTPAARSSVKPEGDLVTEVPDYLRKSRRSALTRWLPAVAALFLLGLVSYGAFGPDGWLRSPQPQKIAGIPPEGESEGTELADAQDPANQQSPPDLDVPLLDIPGGASPEEGVPEKGLGADPNSLGPDPGPVASPLDGPDTGMLDSDPVETMLPGPEVSAGSGGDPAADLGGITNSADAAGMPALTGVPDPADPAPLDPGNAAADEGLADDGQQDPLFEELEPQPVGLLAGAHQVLLRHDIEAEGWVRLATRSAVMTGDRLLSLPTYRPTVSFDSGLTLELVDGALIQIAEEQPEVLAMELVYGRLILANAGNLPASLQLTVGDISAKIEIAPLALLAIEAGRPFTPGANPIVTQSPLEAMCYAPKGGVVWSSSAGEFESEEPSQWRIAGESLAAPEPLQELAEWPDGRELASWEREATGPVETRLPANEPILPQLMELTASRFREQRTLAAICSAHIGYFDPFIKALADEDQKSAWEAEIETLRAAMARSSESALAVQRALVENHGPERAADLYEMLCGYSAEQIGDTPDEWRIGPLRQLVEWLASPLEYRVLANYNLEQITGRRLVFNPIGPPLKRERDIRKFESRLEDGELYPKDLP